MGDDFGVWAEKYRPERLEDIIGQKHVMERLVSFVEKKSIPHMLFAGPAGSGKTSAALCLSKELFGGSWKQNFLELNASNERGIDVIRNKVKDFARSKSLDASFKIICLDESDALTQEAQQALRRTMETYSSGCRFILICNYSSRIIEPIESRCAVFRFKQLEEKEMKKALEKIAKKEGLKVEEGAFEAIYHASEGDMRKAINILQASSLDGKITEKTIYEISAQARPSEVKEMLSRAVEGKFSEARKALMEMLLKKGISGEDIIKEMSRQAQELEIGEKSKMDIISKLGEYEFRISQGGDVQVQLEALLAQLAFYK